METWIFATAVFLLVAKCTVVLSEMSNTHLESEERSIDRRSTHDCKGFTFNPNNYDACTSEEHEELHVEFGGKVAGCNMPMGKTETHFSPSVQMEGADQV